MTIATPHSKGHVVLFAYEAWGHTRPLCNLAARIVRSRGMHITFFTTGNFYERANKELARNFGPDEEHLKSLIRLIVLASDPKMLLGGETYHESFDDAFSKLAKQEPVVCAHSGIEHGALPVPDVAVVDSFGFAILDIVRKYSGTHTRVLAWYSGAVSAIFRFFGPPERGGKGNLADRIQAAALSSGRPADEIKDDVALHATDTLVHIPGLPPMYDYEYHPQLIMFKDGFAKMFQAGEDILKHCDGIFLSTPECYEPVAIASMREWFAETQRHVFVAGPFVPTGELAVHNENAQSAKGAEITRFLDSILDSHGARSMLYISFGSVFWSMEPEKIWAFLDVVMEKKIPFIMSHASPFAVVPEEVTQKVREYGIGLLSPWSPQQTILSHEATGWFVTHGGHNSVMESVTAGIPMICWPFHADQPVNAAHLSHNLNVAYELLEVRNGHGLKPLHRFGKAPTGTIETVQEEARDILTKAYGDDGQEKRANALALKKAIARTWDEDGSSTREFEAFLNYVKP